MATQVQVQCINKTDRYNPHERIKSIGGVHNGERWKMDQQRAVVAIENGEYEFYVRQGNSTAWLIVAKSASGNKYIKTTADGEQPNNLLSLPECP